MSRIAHGTMTRYRKGCRCAACRGANTARVAATRAPARDEDDRHGRPGTYTNDKCRCDRCKAAHAAYQAYMRTLKRLTADPSRIPHGTVGGYDNWSCRCNACRDASQRRSERRRTVSAGQ